MDDQTFAFLHHRYDSLSRWWFMLQLVQSGWSDQGGPGPSDTVAVIVSGTEGGSAETNHPGGSTKAYIPKMINLLARTLPFKIEVVPEDSEIYSDNLWVPGVAAMNYQPCMLRNVEPGVEAVTKALKENSLAGWNDMLVAGSISAARKAQLDEVRKERVYIGRLDAITQNLDGMKRYICQQSAAGCVRVCVCVCAPFVREISGAEFSKMSSGQR